MNQFSPKTKDISIHALLAESDYTYPITVFICIIISIHALLAESDREPTALRTPHQRFLSTLSLRRATLRSQRSKSWQYYFYPRSPCGERLGVSLKIRPELLFLSTLSLRRATFYANNMRWHFKFLSTLSLRRATRLSRTARGTSSNFYPRSPCGERP